MEKHHQSVVRNQGHTRAAVMHVERHNERKNENYSNLDVVLEQSHNNLHYKVCEGTYLYTFDKMVQDGDISTRGLKLNSEGTKPESSIIAEMIFDVNTEYFETHYESHGYTNPRDFAKHFYYEAYQMAVKEVGDEKYILSAVMHADERNKGLSEQLGRDVYHYHLHVTYIPVVQKEIRYTKRAKTELVGKVKEIINQVNHSKKWESEKVVGEDGKEHLIYSYSKLQDRYHDHMKAAGYHGFERGKEGSTAEHLSVLEYKAKMRQEELDTKEKELAVKENELAGKAMKLKIADTDLGRAEKLLAKTKANIEKLSAQEEDISSRIKSIEDSGKILTLKELEKIQTKIHTPLVGHRGVLLSEEDEKNLRATALAAAKATKDRDMFRNISRTAHEAIRDIVQAVRAILFENPLNDDWGYAKNLSPQQRLLINSVCQHGTDVSKSFGYDKLVDEMQIIKIGKTVIEKFRMLEGEANNKKSAPSISEQIESAKQRTQVQNEQRVNIPVANSTRKRGGDER